MIGDLFVADGTGVFEAGGLLSVLWQSEWKVDRVLANDAKKVRLDVGVPGRSLS